MNLEASKLPQAPRPAAEDASDPTPPPPAPNTILIVDDTLANLSVVADFLTQHDFRVMIAQDGEEGLQRTEFALPDLILLDVMMPGIDGFEVCRRLKAHARTRHIPVIFMTALAATEHKLEAFEAGGVDFVTKPLQVDEVLARINTHLRAHLHQRQLAARNLDLQCRNELLNHEIAERTAALAENDRHLRLREQQHKHLFDHLSDGIFVLDVVDETRFRLSDSNQAFERSIAPLRGERLDKDLPESLLPGLLPHYRRTVETGATVKFTATCDGAAALSREFSVVMIPGQDENGRIHRVTCVLRDITDIDQYRAKTQQQVYFDALTGLPNRILLSERMQQAIESCPRNGIGFSLMILDLDNFKEINDIAGHAAGDLLLREVATRLQRIVRTDDSVARLGGDEFALLLPYELGNEDSGAVAERILPTLAEPFRLADREFTVSASIGIARYPDDCTNTDSLYKYAESAMYHSKKLASNGFQFYTPELTLHALERLELESALRGACKNAELELYYQPQVDMVAGGIVGAEALLRWNRPDHGVVTPDRFIPIAEATGLIVDIGEWVLRAACQAAAGWNRGRAAPLAVAVNLSTQQFIHNDLAGTIRRILHETGCRPEWLTLEITENLLLDGGKTAADMLQQLDRLGLKIAVDDFGTGYSPLSCLNRFPISALKIDRSLTADIPHRRDKSELVKAMLSISSALCLDTVAEGVEKQAQADYLMAQGCRLAQGYLYGKPMPATAFDAVLAAAAAA